MAKLKIGDAAPDFKLPWTGEGEFALAEHRGNWVVLAFYPGDFTPTCTKQFCNYRDGREQIDDLDADVVGISPQDVDSHEKFIAEHGLTVPLPPTSTRTSPAPTASWPRAASSSAARSSSSIPRGGSATARSRWSGSGYEDTDDLARGPRRGARRDRGLSGADVRGRRRRASPCAARARGGAAVVLAHGLTAHRDLVVHGSRALRARRLRVDPLRRPRPRRERSRAGGDVHLRRLGDDLAAVVDAQLRRGGATGAGRPLDGRAHDRQPGAPRPIAFAGLVLIGPASVGVPLDERVARQLGRAGRRARADGIDGFIAAYEDGHEPGVARHAVRIARDRLSRHRHLGAVAEAMREVPRSVPFDGMGELEGLDPGAGRRQPRRGRPGPPLCGRRGLRRRAAASATLISEERGGEPARLAGRPALAGDRRLLRLPPAGRRLMPRQTVSLSR